MPEGAAARLASQGCASGSGSRVVLTAIGAHGWTTLTKALAQEVIEQGIRVNAVAPGPVWTRLIPASMSLEQTAKFGKSDPMGRPAQPAELAPVYVFPASADASYINNEVVGVTGGKLLP
ncbi:MAG: SDR family oxidoreductase [Oscillochloris sp.]|nr:SDR family oxidoreductase [Oscillochloris sp.]